MNNTKELTISAMFTVLFIIGSKLVIPTGIIPLTLQTMVVILYGLLLKPKQICLSYGIYFTLGLLGFPVFASGGGLVYVLQPSFGFLLSFPIAACLISILTNKLVKRTFLSCFMICLLALLLIYTIGCCYMYGIMNFYLGTQKSMQTIIAIGALPFFISDSLSIGLATFCALHLLQIPTISRSLQFHP